MNFSKQRKKLVYSMIASGVLKTPEIISSFLETKRENFVLDRYKEQAYLDIPLPILVKQTISQPTTVAIMTEALEPRKSDVVLEIGTGSGYQAAILSKLVKKVYSIERIPELYKFARRNLSKSGIKNVKVICGDGSKGLKFKAPFDKIIVTAGAESIPRVLISQLKTGGILLMPVGISGMQTMIKAVKTKKGLKKENLGYFSFVPLVSKK